NPPQLQRSRNRHAVRRPHRVPGIPVLVLEGQGTLRPAAERLRSDAPVVRRGCLEVGRVFRHGRLSGHAPPRGASFFLATTTAAGNGGSARRNRRRPPLNLSTSTLNHAAAFTGDRQCPCSISTSTAR